MEELEALAKANATQALEAIAGILDAGTQRPSDGPSDADLMGLASSALASIEAEYESAIASKDFPTAISRLDSLKSLSEERKLSSLLPPKAAEAADAWRERRNGLLAQEAEQFYQKGQTAPALLVYLAALQSGKTAGSTFKNGEIALWAGRALQAKDRRSLGILCTELDSRSIALPPGAQDFLSSRDSMATMRSGVVTIRVDRGIKIEQGLGTPDRLLGTGFFIDPAGYALTNYHVISSEVDPKYKGYSHLSVSPSSAPEVRFGAKVVGYDRLLDLALIKVDAVPPYVFSLSEGNDIAPGQKITVIGSPAGLEDTVTSGIVSAVGRRILQSGEAMQVDAALNPGNSGGPVLDDAGMAIGVAFAGMPQFQGLNFAISASWAIKILPDLFRGGEVHRAWLGLALAEKESGPPVPGLEITYRHPSVAAGMEEGDRVLAIGGDEPKDIMSAQSLLLEREPGSLVQVRLSSAGQERTELRYLEERPFSPFESAVRLDRKDRLFPALFGMALSPIPSNIFESANYSITKVWPGYIADESGLSEDDPISLKRFYVDQDQGAVFIQIYVKKRKAGFLESIIQIPASLETPDLI
jgi:S1-C subfamily serine protease